MRRMTSRAEQISSRKLCALSEQDYFSRTKNMITNKKLSYILIFCSLIGLIASFVLTIDTIKLIENPNVELPCNINPILSCKSVASTWQSKIFGFPNPLLGIVAFSMLLTVGILLQNGGKPTKNFWILVNYGNLASILFVLWFIYQSVYKIGSLCLYCMTVWAVTWPIFLYTLIWSSSENYINLGDRFSKFLYRNHIVIFVSWYLLLILLILTRFREYFFS